jgi:copper homeostasis protein
MSTPLLEICAYGINSAMAAEEGGADRVELCDNMQEGGTTPSYGTISQARKRLSIPVFPIIRPRGGDFLYNKYEFDIMKEDIRMCKSLGCEGVVFGILLPDGQVDVDRCSQLMELAQGMEVTFHRAFDHTSDPQKALEDIIGLRCHRMLTSGQHPTALGGTTLLRNLVKQAGNRITIMPGSGINEHNIIELMISTHAKEFHGSLKTEVKSKMQYFKRGFNDADYFETLSGKVRLLKQTMQHAAI